MENSRELFDLALGLSSPWEVQSVKFEEDQEGARELHITPSFKKGSNIVPTCAVCGMVLKASEERYYGNTKNVQDINSAIPHRSARHYKDN